MINVNCLNTHMLGRATKVFDVKTVVDTQTTGPRKVPVRWYIPEDMRNDAPPVIVYFHGGGWVTGMLYWAQFSQRSCHTHEYQQWSVASYMRSLENKDKLLHAIRWSIFGFICPPLQ